MPTERDEQQNKLVVHLVDMRAPVYALMSAQKNVLVTGVIEMRRQRNVWRCLALMCLAVQILVAAIAAFRG